MLAQILEKLTPEEQDWVKKQISPVQWLTVAEAEKRYGRNRTTIQRAIKSGRVYGFVRGKNMFISQESGDSFWLSKESAGT